MLITCKSFYSLWHITWSISCLSVREEVVGINYTDCQVARSQFHQNAENLVQFQASSKCVKTRTEVWNKNICIVQDLLWLDIFLVRKQIKYATIDRNNAKIWRFPLFLCYFTYYFHLFMTMVARSRSWGYRCYVTFGIKGAFVLFYCLFSYVNSIFNKTCISKRRWMSAPPCLKCICGCVYCE